MKAPRPKPKTAGDLHELQKLMATAIMRPLARGDSMQRKWIDGTATRKAAEQLIKPNDRLTSFERLEIYNRQYWFRLRKCLFTDYPGLCAILGEAKFGRLADIYLAQNPSRSFTLRNLGSRLGEFLESNPKLAGPRQSLVLDMARLEWAYIQAFDNEARSRLNVADIAKLNLGNIRLQLQPYLTLLKLKNDIADILIEIKKNAGLRGEASNAVSKNYRMKEARFGRGIKLRTNFVAVHRYGDTVYFKQLEPGQFALLSALQNGVDLESSCAKLASLKISGDWSEKIKEWFRDWTALGWFCGVK